MQFLRIQKDLLTSKIVIHYGKKTGTIERNETSDETDFNYTDEDDRNLITIVLCKRSR